MYKTLDSACYTYYSVFRWMETMRFREAERMILDDGWYFVKQVGSHCHYKQTTKPGEVTIPNHGGKDINPITVKQIIKQAGL